MRILNFGSINIDHVYEVAHFVQPGETIRCLRYHRNAGGKGLNQSIALSRAGAQTFHAGVIGDDGRHILELMKESRIDSANVRIVRKPTGQAIIQVNQDGENTIIVVGGANLEMDQSFVHSVLGGFGKGDFALTQNELNAVAEIIRKSHDRGLFVAFNPAPMTDDVLSYPLDLVDVFFVNETEGARLTGGSEPEKIIDRMRQSFPRASVVLTLGSKGALFADTANFFAVPAVAVEPVDTTAAGDTFIGFFLAEWSKTGDTLRSLDVAARAAAICVTRKGASTSIPWREELGDRAGRS
jgi:ribokinase